MERLSYRIRLHTSEHERRTKFEAIGVLAVGEIFRCLAHEVVMAIHEAFDRFSQVLEQATDRLFALPEALPGELHLRKLQPYPG